MLASDPSAITFGGQRLRGPTADGAHGQVLTTDGAGQLYLSTPSGGGGGSGDSNFTFDQLSASSTWNVVHGLGKFPSVSVVDSSGNSVIGDVHYVDTNSLTIAFSSIFSGTAYLN